MGSHLATRKRQRCGAHEGDEGLNKTPFLIMESRGSCCGGVTLSGLVRFERA